VPRMAAGDRIIEPTDADFCGFVFKIQANMDARHRDRMSFVRIVSGKFERDMTAINSRTGKPIRLANSQKLFAQDRETVNESWAGDVVGLVGNQDYRIGDTLSTAGGILFDEIPRFPPEVFAYLHNPSTAHYKRFREGLDQLLAEGVIQQFSTPGSVSRIPLLGAVGPLQFEVVQYRLQSEYNAESRLETAPWSILRWLKLPESITDVEKLALGSDMGVAQDGEGRWVMMFGSEWSMRYFTQRNEGVELLELPEE
jgi:peptide chain release factor 3